MGDISAALVICTFIVCHYGFSAYKLWVEHNTLKTAAALNNDKKQGAKQDTSRDIGYQLRRELRRGKTQLV